MLRRIKISADLGSGFAVAMIAIPLSLGIAVASNAPPVASLVTLLVAGVVAWRWSGFPLLVSGPAVGLALIVTQGLGKLGSPEAFATATVLAGLIQLMLSRFGAGRLSSLLPSPAIHGMMAAIGLHLVLKQIPHALGVDPDFEGDLSFWERSSNTLLDLLSAVSHPKPGAVIVAGAAFFALWYLRKRPSSVRFAVSVFAGWAMHALIEAIYPSWSLARFEGDVVHLIQIPSWSWSALGTHLRFPDWSALLSPVTWEIGFSLAVLSSLETVLAIEALESLTPESNLGDKDRSLIGQGLTNLFCGLVGALPSAGLLIRSSINVYTGGRTSRSVLWQVAFVALAWFALTPIFNRIPLAALAPCLIWVGYRLADRKVFTLMWEGGPARFWPFLVALLGVLFINVLSGVLLGAALGVVFILWSQHRSALTVVREGSLLLIRFSKDASFLNKLKLAQVLAHVDPGMEVVIDATRAIWVDQDIYDLIEAFRVRARLQNIHLETRHLEGKAWKTTNAFF